jgi:hypothetical protein
MSPCRAIGALVADVRKAAKATQKQAFANLSPVQDFSFVVRR